MNSKLVIRKNELEAADKKDDKALEQVERYRNKLVEIYKSLLDIRNLLQTSESKGHTLDLQMGEADLQKYVDRAIELVNKIMSKKSTLSNFIGYKIEEADFTSFLEELLTLKKLITAIKLNPHMDLKDIQKQLNQYAVDYENGQETLIFARSNNDRNILINHHPYRILREQYINEYFHYYIGQLRDFYLLHWLDHERTQYKANITNFKTQLTRWCDQADSTVNH